jgi:uracil DNA glycosylase
MTDNVVKLTPTTTVTLTVDLPPETVALINKFVALNQHTKNTHGPMSWEKLAQMLLEDVAAAVKDNTTWQGGHAALVLSEHEYRT